MGRRRFNAGSEMTGSSDSGAILRHNRHRIIVHSRPVTDLEPNRRILIPGLAGRIFVCWWCGSVGAASFRIWVVPTQRRCYVSATEERRLPRQRAAINRIRLIIERDHWLRMHDMVAPRAAFGRTMKSILSQDTSRGKPCGLINCKRPDFMGCQPYLAVLLWLLSVRGIRRWGSLPWRRPNSSKFDAAS
jgi:hypothetical protein